MNERDRVRLPLALWSVLVAVLLVGPTLVVVPLSFTDKRSFSFPIDGWSLQWYENFFVTDPRWLDALGTSLRLALVVAALATVLGTLAALAVDRRDKVFAVARGVLLLPVVIPAIVAAIGIFGTYLDWSLSGRFLGLVLAHTALAVPFVIIAVGTSLRGLDPTLERAAASLGAGPVARFVQVQLPVLLPGIVTGFIFAFVTSLDEVVVSYFMQSPLLRTLPVQMYSSVTVETDPSIAVASTLVLLLSTLAILIPGLVVARRQRRLDNQKESA